MSEELPRSVAISRGAKSPGAFRTISEVASELDVPQHVLRFWESKFNQVKPMKRGGGRRYYRPEDVDLLRRIRSLLYDEGYTIKGVQKVLKDRNGGREETRRTPAAREIVRPAHRVREDAGAPPTHLSPRQRQRIEAAIEELGSLRKVLKNIPR
ncbi:MAG: MerR family transcriptional regulator [Alphaproteobacteria bacterium]|nr:MerR family transcriptional regulator [Alphaproteobacteria bacterium]